MQNKEKTSINKKEILSIIAHGGNDTIFKKPCHCSHGKHILMFTVIASFCFKNK